MSKHSQIPKGWKELALEDFLIPTLRKVEKPSSTYKRLGLRSHGKGTFITDVEDPKDVAMDYLYEVKKDDLIVNITFAWEGAIAIVKDTDEGALVSHRFPTYTFNRNIVTPEYFQYIILSKRFFYILGTISPGGAGRNRVLNKKDFLKLRVWIPPLSEQRKIFDVINTWDKAISLVEKLIFSKQQLKKWLIQRLVTGQFCLQGHPEISKKLSMFGELPADYEVENLEDIADIVFSNVDKLVDKNENPVLLCNYLDVFNNSFITSNLPFMKATAKQREIEKFSLKKDDVIITKDSETAEEIAEAAVVADELENVLCGYHLAILRPREQKIDGTFLMYALHNHKIRRQFVQTANGVTRFGLTTDSISHAKVVIPPLLVQRKISDCLKIVDTEIDLLKQKLVASKKQKKGLIQKLLTGQVRVKV